MMIRRPRWREHPHVRSGQDLSIGERASDWLKHWFGTWAALGLVGVVLAVWISSDGFGRDPAPYILLNLVLSCLAAVQGIVLQIAANRGDRISSELALSTHDNGQELLKLNQQQMVILNELRELRKLLEHD